MESQKGFLQDCMYEALIKLMRQFPLKEISVSQLCQEAGVSRMTYYRNYHSKEDILLAHLDEVFGHYYRILSEMEERTLYHISLAFFQMFLGSEREFFRLMTDSIQSTVMMDKFYRYLEDILSLQGENRDVSPYLRSFWAGGLYKLSLDWFRAGTLTPPEEMALLLIHQYPDRHPQ